MAQWVPGKAPHKTVMRGLHPSNVPLVPVQWTNYQTWYEKLHNYGIIYTGTITVAESYMQGKFTLNLAIYPTSQKRMAPSEPPLVKSFSCIGCHDTAAEQNSQ